MSWVTVHASNPKVNGVGGFGWSCNGNGRLCEYEGKRGWNKDEATARAAGLAHQLACDRWFNRKFGDR